MKADRETVSSACYICRIAQTGELDNVELYVAVLRNGTACITVGGEELEMGPADTTRLADQLGGDDHD